MTKVQAHTAGKKIYPTLIPPLLKLAEAPIPQRLHKVTGEKLQRLLREPARSIRRDEAHGRPQVAGSQESYRRPAGRRRGPAWRDYPLDRPPNPPARIDLVVLRPTGE